MLKSVKYLRQLFLYAIALYGGNILSQEQVVLSSTKHETNKPTVIKREAPITTKLYSKGNSPVYIETKINNQKPSIIYFLISNPNIEDIRLFRRMEIRQNEGLQHCEFNTETNEFTIAYFSNKISHSEIKNLLLQYNMPVNNSSTKKAVK